MSMFRSLSHKMLAAMFIAGGASNFLGPERVAPKVANAGVSQARQATALQGVLMLIGGTLLALDIMPEALGVVTRRDVGPNNFHRPSVLERGESCESEESADSVLQKSGNVWWFARSCV
jgi:hypothetical protein